MQQTTNVRAPYNFVPFSNRILAYDPAALPAHDAVDPALKTGEIRVTLTAETPVFLSNGKKEAHFFRGPDGKMQIPGSTIRGLVRQNMQILGFGLVRLGEDMQDQRVFYRNIANSRTSVGGELKEYYHKVLKVTSFKSPSGKTYSIPMNVKAGYLRRGEDGDCYIQPVKGKYVRVSRKILEQAGLEQRHAEVIPVCYTASADHATAVYQNGDKGQRGFLLCPGVDIGGDGTRIDKKTGKLKPPSHRYIFPLADEQAAPVAISKEDELSYAADWEVRKNVLEGGTQIEGTKIKYNPDFWKLPEKGREKPVFYTSCDGHVFFGMSLFLRIGHRYSLREGLPESHLEKQEDSSFLDWPRAILGWAGKEKSRCSRVSFGDFPAQGEPEEMPPVKTVLGGPKISFYPGYLEEDGAHYSKAKFRLRGYKQYWHKEPCPAATDKEKVASTLRPLPAGTKFFGVIRYRNLKPEELGLLLWSIRLEEDCHQSVGMGKPYGYGRVKVSVDELRELDIAGMYCPDRLCAPPAAADPGAVQRYIDAYDAAAAKALALKTIRKKGKENPPSVANTREIQDFFYLKRTIRRQSEVSYMELAEYQNPVGVLPTVGDIRRDAL